MKFGILGAGRIAVTMAETVRRMNERGDSCAELYAVASRDMERAQTFARQNGVQKAFGSYADMLADPALEAVYIATPHSHHYRQIKLCADAGKHVLCEKAFTVNARQAQEALGYARKKGVLAAEAIWTRYQPMRRIIAETLASGIIGEPRTLSANLCYMITDKERIVKRELAGGALLDVGVYTLNFAEMAFGHACRVNGSCTKNEDGVDMHDSMTLEWEDGRTAALYAAADCVSDRRGVICGSEGFIAVENINNPQSFTVYDKNYRVIREQAAPAQLTGYEYEVREFCECAAAGKPECPSMPHAETVRMMEVMDSLRAQMGVVYPCEDWEC